MKKIIPNLMTCGNLWLSFVILVQIDHIHGNMFFLWLLGAIMFDILDGFLARKLDATSEFGMHLDSLSDILSFGLLPSAYLYHHILVSTPFIIFASVPLLFTALRLARFNTTGKKSYFIGLPSPANALLIVTCALIFGSENSLWLTLVTILSSLLMLSCIPYPTQIGSIFSGALFPIMGLLAPIHPVRIIGLISLLYVVLPIGVYVLRELLIPLLHADFAQLVPANPEVNTHPPASQNE